MEVGQYQLQIFVSLVVILAAAFVSLICDFLKGRNERLRELSSELKMRREDEQKRPQLTMLRPFETTPFRQPPPPADVSAVPPSMADARAAFSETLVKTTDQEGTQRIVAAQAAARHRINWSELLARRTQGNRVAVTATAAPAQALPVEVLPDLLDAVGAETSSQNPQAPDVSVPAGFHDGFVLSRLVQSHKPVSGLVVSIGVSASRTNAESASQAVRNLIESLIGPQDFACASAPDEYLLIFPHERGASAQRRLTAISQKLWDFQLQMLGEASVLFSWGGLEVCSESMEEAIALASERMEETRRSRSAKSFDTTALKIAV